MMRKIELESYEEFYLSKEKKFILRKGKVVVRSIKLNGKVINNNMFLEEGEIIFDCFNYFEKNENMNIKIKVIALENTVLEEITLKKNSDKEIYKTMLIQLMNKNALEVEEQLYTPKGSILAMLKRYASNDGIINKKNIRPDFFYLGKTQFYKLYKIIKNEEFIKEEEKKVYLNIQKIDSYLLELKNISANKRNISYKKTNIMAINSLTHPC
ncbi:MAG: hypothetical protein ACRC6K_08775 [Fusobacteriaceae bacterium]